MKSLIIIFFSSPVLAISEEEFAQTLLANQRLFEYENLNLQSKEIEVDYYYKAYGGWTWDIEASAENTRIITDKDYLGTETYDSKSYNLTNEVGSSINTNFFSTGIELDLSLSRANVNDLDFETDVATITTSALTPSITTKNAGEKFQNTAKLTLKVPFLKNRGGIIDQTSYDTSLLSLESKKLTLIYKKEKILARALEQFFKWGLLEKKHYHLRRRISMAQKTLSRSKKIGNSKNILLASNALSRVLNQELSVRDDIIQQQKALSALINMPLAKVYPKINWNKKAIIVSDLKLFLNENAILLKKIKLQQATNQRKIKAYRNSKAPNLDLVLSAQKEKDIGDLSTTYTENDTDTYKIGLYFKYRLSGDNTNNKNLAKEVIKTRQLQIKYEDVQNSMIARLQAMVEKIGVLDQRIKLFETKMINSQKAANNEVMNFYDGQIDIRFLIKSQDDWLRFAWAHDKALYEYRRISLNYSTILNQTLAQY